MQYWKKHKTLKLTLINIYLGLFEMGPALQQVSVPTKEGPLVGIVQLGKFGSQQRFSTFFCSRTLENKIKTYVNP